MGTLLPLVGLTTEYQRLMMSLNKRQPLLLVGPAGAGKTAVISAVLNDLPTSLGVISSHCSSNLHQLLIHLARALIKRDHAAFRLMAMPGNDPDKWLAKQTSIRLKGLLWSALEVEPCPVVLDSVSNVGFPMYRFLQRLYFVRGMMFVAAARDQLALGALRRLFWDPRNTVHLRRLNDAEANQLFDLAVERFKIGYLDIGEFREKVIQSAKGNPGQIVEMCRLASNPAYITGTHIKFAPLRIDALMRFL
mgnify:CR=1 FL=1